MMNARMSVYAKIINKMAESVVFLEGNENKLELSW